MRRIPVVARVVAVLAVTVVAGGCGTGVFGGGDDVVERTDGLSVGGWMAARTTDDGLRIVVVGAAPLRPRDPCTADYEAAAVESDSEVRVTITTRSPRPPDEYGCSAVGYTRLIDVILERPLGGRQVVFDPFGQPEDVFDASGLLEPEVLPEGWSSLTESGFSSDPDLSPAWSVTWSRPPEEPTGGACSPGAAPVTLTQGSIDLLGFFGAHATEAGQAAVRGTPATLLTSRLVGDRVLVWTEDPYGYALTSSEACSGDEVLTTEQLVAFAETLR